MNKTVQPDSPRHLTGARGLCFLADLQLYLPGTMKTLPTEFTRLGFTHRQVERQGNVAIFERKKPHWSHSHFEVIRIRPGKAFQRAGVQFEAQERYPASFDWGQRGFTCTNLASARTRAAKMLKSGEITQK